METFAAVLPAALINVDPSIPEAPVLGWAHCGGGRCLPLVLGRPGGLVTGDAIRAEGSDHVFDLVLGQKFEDEDEWRNFLEAREQYRPGLTSPLLAYPGQIVIKLEPTPEAKLAVLPKAGEVPVVQFGGKPYAKQTFWQAPPEKPQVIFVLEKGTPCPLAGAEKITRDTFYELRKSLVEVHQSVFNKPDPNQPELPLEEEDDGTDDLI